MTSEILGRSTQGHIRLENLQADLAPLADRLESNATVDERLGEISSVCSEGICSDNDGTGHLVGFEEGKGLSRGEEVEELLGEVRAVAVILKSPHHIRTPIQTRAERQRIGLTPQISLSS